MISLCRERVNSILKAVFIVLAFPVVVASQLDFYFTSWHVYAKTYLWPLQLKVVLTICAFHLVIKSKDSFVIQTEQLFRNPFFKWLIIFLLIQCPIFLVIDFPQVAEWLARIVLVLFIPALLKAFLIGGIFQKRFVHFSIFEYLREFYNLRKWLGLSALVTLLMGAAFLFFYKTEWQRIWQAPPYHAELKEVYFPDKNVITPYNPTLNLTLSITHHGGQPVVWENFGEKQVFLGVHWFKKVDGIQSDTEFIPKRAFHYSHYALHTKVFPKDTILETISLNSQGVPNGEYIVVVSLQQGTKHHLVWFPNFASNFIKVSVIVNIPNRLSETIAMTRSQEMQVLVNQDFMISRPDLVRSEISYINLGNKFAIRIKNVGDTPWESSGPLGIGIGYRCMGDHLDGDNIVDSGILQTRQTMYPTDTETVYLFKNPDWVKLCFYLKVGLVVGETWMEGLGDPVLMIPNKELKDERRMAKEIGPLEDFNHLKVIQAQKEMVQFFEQEATLSKIAVNLQVFNQGEVIQDQLHRWSNTQVLQVKIHNQSALTLPSQLISIPDLGSVLLTIRVISLYGETMDKVEFMIPFNLPPSAWIMQPFRLAKPLSRGEYKLKLSLDFTYPPKNKIAISEKKYSYFIH